MSEHDSLDDAALSALYHRTSGETSPETLDQKILAAAEARVGERPRVRYLRWFPVVSASVVAILVVFPVAPPSPHLTEQPPHPLILIEAEENAYMAPAHSGKLMDRPARAVQSPMLEQRPNDSAVERESQSVVPAIKQELPVFAEPAIAVPPAPELDGIPQAGPTQDRFRARAVPSPFANMSGGDSPRSAVEHEPAQWLQSITTLLDQGYKQLAQQEYQRFLIAHPNYVVDTALSQRLDKLGQQP